MKKVLLGIFGLAFAASMSLAISLNTTSVSVSAAEVQTTDVFTETKCQVSKNGDKMLVVTGIKDVSLIYEMGYDVNGSVYTAGEGEYTEGNVYYESLTLGGETKLAGEFLTDAEGLLIWEINYNPTVTYTVQPFAYFGEMNSNGQLMYPETEVKSYGAAKENFNVLTLTIVDEGGATLKTVPVNYGATISAPEADELDGFVFDGYYVDGVEFDFTKAITKSTTITAKYNAIVNYTVEVLAAQYAGNYIAGGYYDPDLNSLKYVDKTADYASLLGLGENGQMKGVAGEDVDLTKAVNAIPAGAKVSESSVLTATIAEDGSTKLTIKLDFDEEALGFSLSDITLGQWNGENITYTIGYLGGECGLAIDGTIGNGNYLTFDLGNLKASDYAAIILNYKEKSVVTSTKVSAGHVSEADWNNNTITPWAFYNISNPDTYLDGTTDLKARYPEQENFEKIVVKLYTKAEKHIFISGIEAIKYTRENVTYSVDNNNIADIVKPLNESGTFSVEENHAFVDGGDIMTANAYLYTFSSETGVSGAHKTGVKIDLGGIRLSDYKTIRIVYHKSSYVTNVAAGQETGTAMVAFCGTTNLNATQYSSYARWTIDVKAKAEAAGLTEINSLELSMVDWAQVTSCKIWIAEIVLELADGIVPDSEHVHNFVEGKCECGEEDPNYVPPHEHNFVEGKCECGEEDPTYVPPHEHNFVEGKCECGEEDPNYVPPHEHNFVEGKCECGEEDPNYEPPVEEIIANYTVKVMVMQYARDGGNSGWYAADTSKVTYVDRTSEYASLLGLDVNNQLQGVAGTEADLTDALKELPAGVKVSLVSKLQGTIAEDGSLVLTVKLDFDEAELGFKVKDVVMGTYNISTETTYTLQYFDGVIGLAIDIPTLGAYGKSVTIDVDDILASNYVAATLVFYETNPNATKFSAFTGDTESAQVSVDKVAAGDYQKFSLNLLTAFAGVTEVSKVKVALGTNAEKHLFIAAIDKTAYTRKTVTYSIDNDNLADIASTMTAGQLTQEYHAFPLSSTEVVRYDALLYTFATETPVVGKNRTGLTLDLGGIKLADYKTIKFRFQKAVEGFNDKGEAVTGITFVVGCNGVELTYQYTDLGSMEVDIKALAEAKGLTSISNIELSVIYWAQVTSCKVWVAPVVLELADGVEGDVEAPAVEAVSSIKICADNDNILDIASVIGTGATLTTEKNYEIAGVLNNNLCYRHPDVVSEPGVVPGELAMGIRFDFGGLNVSDYASMKLQFRALADKGADGKDKVGTLVYINGIKVSGSHYGGNHLIDLIELAKANGIEKIETVELCVPNWDGIPNYNIFVSYIDLVAATQA